jgi:hypothetical protein
VERPHQSARGGIAGTKARLPQINACQRLGRYVAGGELEMNYTTASVRVPRVGRMDLVLRATAVLLRGFVGALLLFSAPIAHAIDANLHLAFGLTAERGTGDGRFSGTLRGDVGEAAWLVRPELSLQYNEAPLFDRAETEISAGAIHYWSSERYAVHLGAGVTEVSFRFDGTDGSSSGPYAHAGVTWPIAGGHFVLGFDGRYVWAGDTTVRGVRHPVAYRQIALLLGWRF